MRTLHLLRKFDAAEWGGTESAVQRLLAGLKGHGVESVLYAPTPANPSASKTNGHAVKHFKACVPVWGLSPQEKRQFIAVGGNLFSFDLLPALWREQGVELIHTHTLGRLGGIAATVARQRRIPLVVTIHGGYLDLPKPLQESFSKPSNHGFDWGRVFGLLLQSRRMLYQADALLTCNPTEAALLRNAFPKTRVEVLPHGIPLARYQEDCWETALAAWPQLRTQQVLLCVGRIDPVKNQGWLVDQAQRIFAKHPDAVLVFAGPSTNEQYSQTLKSNIAKAGVDQRVIFTGGLPPEDPRLIGLLQLACAVVLPSISETFGLVLLEAWAARTTVISTRTSGAQALIEHSKDGWLFDLDKPETFHHAVDAALENSEVRSRFAANGHAKVKKEFDVPAVALRAKQLYHQLIEAKACTT